MLIIFHPKLRERSHKVNNFLFLFGQTSISSQTTITYTLTAQSTYWEYDDGELPISINSSLEEASAIIIGSTTSEPSYTGSTAWKGFAFGWEDHAYEYTDFIAYGFYEVTNSFNSEYFYIDIRDCKYSGTFSPCTYYNPDFFVRYNGTLELLQWKEPGGNWTAISTGEILNVWDIRNNGTQPTSSEFENYWGNALVLLKEGNHPRIVWGPHPTFEATSYKVYRAVSSTPLAHPEIFASVIATVGSTTYKYEDYDVSFSPSGNYIYYFVKGYNGSYSGRTNIALVRGGFFYKKNVSDEDEQKLKFKLNQNHPNPFNPSTTINYTVAENSFISLKVYDVLGKEIETIINEQKTAGEYGVKFDASDLPGGVYIYQLRVNDFISSRKMLLLK